MSADAKPARRPLGRGLSALLGEAAAPVAVNSDGPVESGSGGARTVQLLDIARITPHPDQPRRRFDPAALDELAESISTRGVIQPIVVRPAGNDHYQIVAGERRWRAAQKAQLHRIPAIVRDFDEAETLEIALVENIQREDLNAIEEAQAYKRLIGQFGHSQDALARIVGKSRSHIANLMRLLDLPDHVQGLVSEGQLSMGHGRALIGVPGGEKLADEIARKGLSVRETERLVRNARSQGKAAGGASTQIRDADVIAMERHISDMLGLKASISFDGRAGALTLNFANLDQLDMIVQRLHGGDI